MAVSQNGYEANNRSLITSVAVPGGKITMRSGDVATVLAYVAVRFHNEVEGLVWPGNWGYAERVVRGGTDLSNHASGTAIDLNAPRHPLAKVGTFNAAQRNAIRNILNFCEGVVRWGGDYTGRKDEMHFEINAGTGAVNRIANKIRAAGGLPATTAPAPSAPSTGGGTITYRDIPLGGVSELYTKGEQCRKDQFDLSDSGFKVTVDGYFGPGSVAVTKKFQHAVGLTEDGAFGPNTRDRIHKIPSWNNGNHTAREWQQKLKDRGWHITVDNAWGAKSASILKQFQAEKRIAVDGLRGPESWAALWAHPVT